MRFPLRLLIGALAVSAAASAQVPPIKGPVNYEAIIAARCKAASFARRPPGEMATTIRDLQIQRCIKNKGFLDDPR